MTPAIRKFSNGDVVVDYVRQWFRIHADGRITARRLVSTPGGQRMKAFQPTAAKIEKVKADIIALLPEGKPC